MKKLILSLFLPLIFIGMNAQDIKLPQPQKDGGKQLMQVLNERKTVREFSEKEIPLQTLSNLLWAAWGYNREDKRTAPSAMNWQEIDIYVFLKNGVYIYNAQKNILTQISKDDLRKDSGMQPFVEKAPLNLVFIADKSKTKGPQGEDLNYMIFADSGFIAQNVYLFCASENLNCVVRGSINKENLKSKLNLKDNQMITLAQTIGYGK